MLTVEKIAGLLKPVLDGADLVLLDLKLLGSHGRTAFYAVIDHRHRPVGVDELAAVSRRFEELLDLNEEVPREYSLDVTSPGVEHPLSQEWEFVKNIGRTLSVQAVAEAVPPAVTPEREGAIPPGGGGQTGGSGAERIERFEAKLTGVENGVLSFDGGRELPLARVHKAQVKLPW